MRRPAALPAVVCAAVLAAGAGCGSSDDPEQSAGPTFQPTPTTAADKPAGEPVAPKQERRAPLGSLSAEILRATDLRASPGGKVVGRLKPRTEYKSPRLLPIVKREGQWLGVISTEMPNNKVGWIRNAGLRFFRSPYAIQVRRDTRKLIVRKNGKQIQSIRVAVGRPSSETPLGVYGVTDKLRINRYSPYGCCVLALSGKQPNTPQGWGGGDRLAIHATSDPSSIGQAVSLGCIRAPTDAMRKLLTEIPLGTRVRVTA